MACGNCGGEHGGWCGVCKLFWILIVIGGLNWGLVGLGGLITGDMWSYNVVHLLLGSWAWLESLVYLIVGLATLVKVLKLCKCHGKCEAPAAGAQNGGMHN